MEVSACTPEASTLHARHSIGFTGLEALTVTTMNGAPSCGMWCYAVCWKFTDNSQQCIPFILDFKSKTRFLLAASLACYLKLKMRAIHFSKWQHASTRLYRVTRKNIVFLTIYYCFQLQKGHNVLHTDLDLFSHLLKSEVWRHNPTYFPTEFSINATLNNNSHSLSPPQDECYWKRLAIWA
jgi:hypothetical protein